MRPILTIYILLAFVLFYSTACEKDAICVKGKGAIERRTVNIPVFNEIELEGSGTVYITQGAEQKVEIETNNNLFDYVNDKLSGNSVWRAGFSKCTDPKTFNVYITTPDIRRIRLSGSGSVIGLKSLNTANLTLDLSGSGNMNLETAANYLSTTISGSGNVRLKGTATGQSITISGSGEVFGSDLISDNVTTNTKGSGNCWVTANKTLNVNISGSGNVFYNGTPAVNTSIKGSGNVIRN